MLGVNTLFFLGFTMSKPSEELKTPYILTEYKPIRILRTILGGSFQNQRGDRIFLEWGEDGIITKAVFSRNLDYVKRMVFLPENQPEKLDTLRDMKNEAYLKLNRLVKGENIRLLFPQFKPLKTKKASLENESPFILTEYELINLSDGGLSGQFQNSLGDVIRLRWSSDGLVKYGYFVILGDKEKDVTSRESYDKNLNEVFVGENIRVIMPQFKPHKNRENRKAYLETETPFILTEYELIRYKGLTGEFQNEVGDIIRLSWDFNGVVKAGVFLSSPSFTSEVESEILFELGMDEAAWSGDIDLDDDEAWDAVEQHVNEEDAWAAYNGILLDTFIGENIRVILPQFKPRAKKASVFTKLKLKQGPHKVSYPVGGYWLAFFTWDGAKDGGYVGLRWDDDGIITYLYVTGHGDSEVLPYESDLIGENIRLLVPQWKPEKKRQASGSDDVSDLFLPQRKPRKGSNMKQRFFQSSKRQAQEEGDGSAHPASPTFQPSLADGIVGGIAEEVREYIANEYDAKPPGLKTNVLPEGGLAVIADSPEVGVGVEVRITLLQNQSSVDGAMQPPVEQPIVPVDQTGFTPAEPTTPPVGQIPPDQTTVGPPPQPQPAV